MKTRAGLGIGLVSVLAVLPVQAQEVATLALRNGERPSGELVDLTTNGFILRIGGQDRAFPSGEVRTVEFVVGPVSGEAQAKIDAGRPFVILRSGQLVDGRLSDIGGNRPLRLTIDTPGGSRDFPSSEVAQVWVNPEPRAAGGQAALASPAPLPAGAITVPARVAWTDTGTAVTRGQLLQFSATGDIMLSPGASSGPGGSPAATLATVRYPVSGAPAGSLIGRIGNGAPFPIGVNAQPIQAGASGRLMLGVNDDNMADNSGNYFVKVTVTPVRGPRRD